MQNAIEIKSLTKHYKDFSLNDVSFTLPSGCITGLVGENGAGKSTTIKAILNMIKKNSGTIKLLGHDYTECSMEDIGVVMDECYFPECFNAKEINHVFKNIYKNWNEKSYFSLIKQFRLPENKKLKEFSRGMKMKLSIAAALSHNAKLLILDEPTGGLDPVVRDEILDIFYDFTRDENHSILISSHIVSDLEKLCDYIAFLGNGRLLLFEEKDELLNSYCRIQTDEEYLSKINPQDILGIKRSQYGIEAVVKRKAVSGGINTSAISLEDIFICMSRRIQK